MDAALAIAALCLVAIAVGMVLVSQALAREADRLRRSALVVRTGRAATHRLRREAAETQRRRAQVDTSLRRIDDR